MRPSAQEVAAVVLNDLDQGRAQSESKAIEALVETGAIKTWAKADLNVTSESLLLKSFEAAVDFVGTKDFDQQALQEILRTGLATYFYHRKAAREAKEKNTSLVVGSVFKPHTAVVKMIEDGIARDHRNARIKEDVAASGHTIDNSVIDFVRKYLKEKIAGDFQSHYFETVINQGLRIHDI